MSNSLKARVAAVTECRELFGKQRARELWRNLGLPMPVPTVRPDLSSERLGEFIRHCIEPATAYISFRSIRAAHQAWCELKGVPLASECALGRALRAHGYVKDNSTSRMTYAARLLAPSSAPPPQ